MKVLLALAISGSTSVSLASPGTLDCDVQAIKLTRTIIKTEKMYSDKLFDGEVRYTIASERDKVGNVYQTVDVGWRVGPSQRIVSKYLWEEGHCTLVSVVVK